MYKIKIIKFFTSLFFLGLLFTENVNALSRPTAEIAKARASAQQRQNRLQNFVSRPDRGQKIYEDAPDPVGAQRIDQCQKKEIFLCPEKNPEIGICVSNELKNYSETVSMSIRRHEASQNKDEPLQIIIPQSFGAIRDAIGILQAEQETIDRIMKSKPSNVHLANILNVVSYLNPPLKPRLLLSKIEVMMNKDSSFVNNGAFQLLDDHFQHELLSDSIKTLLQEGIVKKGLLTTTASSGFPIVVSSNGERFVTLDQGKVDLSVFNSNTNDYDLKIFPLSGGACSCVTISPDGSTIVAANPAGIKILNTNEIIGAESFSSELISLPNNTIKFLMLNYDGSVLVFCDQQDNIVIRNLRTGSVTKISKKEVVGFDVISKVLINSSGNKVAVLHDDFLDICSIGTNEVTTSTIQGSFKDVVLSFDGSRVIALENNGKIALLGIDAEGRVIGNYLIGHKKSVYSAVFSYDGRYIASAGEDGFCLWEAKSAKKIYGPSGDATLLGAFSGVAFSHDGKRLLLYSSYVPGGLYIDQNERLVCYDIEKILTSGNGPISPEFTMSVSERVKQISSLCFSDNDRRVIIGGNPTVIKRLLSDEQVSILNKIEKCTIEQKRLIYQLAFDFQFGKPMKLKEGSVESTIFKTLPDDIQKALYHWLGTKQGGLSKVIGVTRAGNFIVES